MKRPSQNEMDVLDLINKIQAQLIGLDKKIDTLMSRSLAEAKPSLRPLVNNALSARPNDHKGRLMYTAICADCKKECSIPFKPSGERPVYCKDCFSRRKVISLSGIKNHNRDQEAPAVHTSIKAAGVQKLFVKKKKTANTAKKFVVKKKAALKLKRHFK